MSKKDIADRLYEAAIDAWSDWLATFAVGGRSVHTASAILRQDDALSMRSTTPGVHSNPMLSHLLAEERAWWSAAASIDAIISGLPQEQRRVVLGSALGYSQTEIGEALGMKQQRVSEMLKVARQAIVMRLRLTASVVRWIGAEQGINLPPPAHSGLIGACAV